LATAWGQTVKFSRILIHLNALKQLLKLANTSTCREIEPLKLAFPAQVTYNVNQASIQLQFHKLMQDEKKLQLESKKLVDL
jgi:hypothetical protein